MPCLKMFHQRINVFSFRALLLEIITRSKNSTAADSDKALNLQTNVWNCYTKGVALQLINGSLDGHTSSKVMPCIHICLLCVKEHSNYRSSICSVVVMLIKGWIKLQYPRKQANPLWDLHHGVA
ncbi:hypothetical protein PVAP13_2KG020800 [Panicum virgatum]|uniref:Uncharacterized protein n=1 Tax=Panicum virgatum TaxID=38727 RepID=A0A8T0W4P8_PANVG|nr:hypothetical protein PVAP13_2KG020800 [Panicum virgatum]